MQQAFARNKISILFGKNELLPSTKQNLYAPDALTNFEMLLHVALKMVELSQIYVLCFKYTNLFEEKNRF